MPHSTLILTSVKEPVVLVGALQGSFLASFLLGWAVTNAAGLASYPLDTIRRRMMMTSGSTVHYKSMFDAASQVSPISYLCLCHTSHPVAFRSSPKRVQNRSSRVLALTSFVVLLVLVCCHCTTSSKKSCSARSTPAVCDTASTVRTVSHLSLHRFRLSACHLMKAGYV